MVVPVGHTTERTVSLGIMGQLHRAYAVIIDSGLGQEGRQGLASQDEAVEDVAEPDPGRVRSLRLTRSNREVRTAPSSYRCPKGPAGSAPPAAGRLRPG